jgi:hypothetical protein
MNYIVTFEIKDNCFQYFTGENFSEVASDAKKYDREEAERIAAKFNSGIVRHSFHARTVK